MKFNRDCKSFPGTFSCEIMTAEGFKDCEDCPFYEPISKKILIIKLGAMGDVIRTTPLISLIKNKYGDNIQITWLVNKVSKDLLTNNPEIDRILVYNEDNVLRLQYEEFDVVYSLEIDVPGTALANLVKGKEKFGFYLNKDGHPECFNENSRFYLNRVFSNYVNQNNNKKYQEMMAEIMELKYEKTEPVLNFIGYEEGYANEFLRKNHLSSNDKLIGIHMGSASRWPSKIWNKNKLAELIKRIYSETDYKVVLFGGPNEIKSQRDILEKLSDLKIYVNDPNNSVREFFGLVNLCGKMLVNDSFALHTAIALKKETVALFFCTPDWEIEGYGRVKKIVSPLMKDNFFTDEYLPELIDSISVDEVFEVLV